MNQEQAKKLAKWLCGILGGFLMGWATSRGYQWGDLINQLLSSEAVIGFVVMCITGVMAWITGRLPNLVAVVAHIAEQPNSPVKAVITEPTKEGKALAEAIPSPTVVPAGTTQAVEMAKPA